MKEYPLTHPYPVPEFIAHLEQKGQEQSECPEAYTELAQQLQVCFDIVERANKLWKEGWFLGEQDFERSLDVLGDGEKRLFAMLLKNMVGGWWEVTSYIDDPENYPWFDPGQEYPSQVFADIRAEQERKKDQVEVVL